jgi:uncharacterized protein YheU (UPF0270 family)
MTLEELAIAQDTLNDAIEALVSTFVTDSGATLQHGNIQVYTDNTNGTSVVNVSTSVEINLNGARVTRFSPSV